MAADPNIFQQYLGPVRSVADYAAENDRRQLNALQLIAQRRQNDLAGLQAEQTRASLADTAADRNALQRLAAGWTADTTPEQRVASLRNSGRAGLMSQADALEKAAGDQLKTRAVASKDQAEADAKRSDLIDKKLARSRELLGSLVTTPAAAAQWVAAQYEDPEIGPLMRSMGSMQDAIARIPSDPAQFEAWRAKGAAGIEKYAASLKAQTNNVGGATVTQVFNPYTQALTEVGRVKNTQSPDNAATNATTRRGQDLVDARTREANAAALSKPFEVTTPDGKPALVQQDKRGNITPVQGYGPAAQAPKPLTDSQSKAVLFGSRAEAANAVLDSLASEGTTTSIPGSRAGFGVGATLNVLSTAKQQQLNQAKRDFLNAVLRRESGAIIGEPEFENGDKQYFPQPGDSKQVIAQKQRNRAIAIRGIQAEVPEAHRSTIRSVIDGPAAGNSSAVDEALKKYGG